jgi:hypothetical protein
VDSTAFYSVLTFRSGLAAPQPIGLILYWPPTEEVYLCFRHSFEDIADPDDVEVLELLGDDLVHKFAEHGGLKTIEMFEDTLSNAIGISERHKISVLQAQSPSALLDQLFIEHVQSAGQEKPGTAARVFRNGTT